MMGVGSKVVWDGKNGHQHRKMTSGIYTIVDTSEYMMCGMIEIEDSLGNRWGIDPSVLKEVEA